jgi:hypothetical protein
MFRLLQTSLDSIMHPTCTKGGVSSREKHLFELVVRTSRMGDSPLKTDVSVHLMEVLPKLWQPHRPLPSSTVSLVALPFPFFSFFSPPHL